MNTSSTSACGKHVDRDVFDHIFAKDEIVDAISNAMH